VVRAKPERGADLAEVAPHGLASLPQQHPHAREVGGRQSDGIGLTRWDDQRLATAEPIAKAADSRKQRLPQRAPTRNKGSGSMRQEQSHADQGPIGVRPGMHCRQSKGDSLPRIDLVQRAVDCQPMSDGIFGTPAARTVRYRAGRAGAAS